MPKGNGREVFIRKVLTSYMVIYRDRAKYSRHSPAQFYVPDHTVEFVEKWCRDNGYVVVPDPKAVAV